MKKIVLIPCCGEKRTYKTKAEDLYISPLFKKKLQYAKSLNADKIFILSAKYGLIGLNDEIAPYDYNIKYLKIEEVKEWSANVLNQMRKITDLKKDEFIFLVGKKYREYLLPHLTHYKIPLEKLRIGKQNKWLNDFLMKKRMEIEKVEKK